MGHMQVDVIEIDLSARTYEKNVKVNRGKINVSMFVKQ